MANSLIVTVTLDNSTPPKFAIKPDPLPVPHGKGIVKWVQGAGSREFEFTALAFSHPNPFQNIIVSAREILAEDDNQKREDHIYSVLVKVKTGNTNTYYNSHDHYHTANGPTIRNT